MKTKINIVLVDDHPVYREGLKTLFPPYIKVTGEANNGQELLDMLAVMEEKPQIILLDLFMPVMNGIETTKKLRNNKLYADIRIIIISVQYEALYIKHMMLLGVNGYLFKSTTLDEIKTAFDDVCAGKTYFNAAFLSALQQEQAQKFDSTLTGGNFTGLTKREEEILMLICQEKTDAEIAGILHISTRTVNGHRQHLLDKTGAINTAGLVIFAVKNNLLLPG